MMKLSGSFFAALFAAAGIVAQDYHAPTNWITGIGILAAAFSRGPQSQPLPTAPASTPAAPVAPATPLAP